MKKTQTNLTAILCMMAMLFFSVQSFAQGDDCATAVAAAPGTGIVADGPAAGAGASNICATGATNADWYTWTAPGCGTVDITSTNDPASTDTRVSFYDGTCAALNCIATDDDGGAGFTSTLTGVGVTAGTTYYIEWDDRWSASGFEWDFTFTTGVVPPAISITNSGAAESLRVFFIDANGDEQLSIAEILPGATVAIPNYVSGTEYVVRTFPHNILAAQGIIDLNCGAFDLPVDPCLGDATDNDGDGLCDASTTCTSGTGAFNVYNGVTGNNTKQSFATTFINGPYDNELYTNNVADMVGFSGNLVYLQSGGLVYSYIFNNGWLKTEYAGDMTGLNIIGVTGAKALVLEADGSIDVYSLATGAKLRDNAETAAIDGPLSGTAFAAMPIIGATSTNTFLVAEADGSTVEYSSVFGRLQNDGAGTTLSGGQNDGSTFMAEAANTVGAHGRDVVQGY